MGISVPMVKVRDVVPVGDPQLRGVSLTDPEARIVVAEHNCRRAMRWLWHCLQNMERVRWGFSKHAMESRQFMRAKKDLDARHGEYVAAIHGLPMGRLS